MTMGTDRGMNTRMKRVALGVPIVGVVGVYLASVLHVGWISFRHGETPISGRRIIRVAHSLAEPLAQAAFRSLADEYEGRHSDVRVFIQAIPRRAYEQWVTTQLMGDTAPDLIQILNRSGTWNNLAQEYLQTLAPYVGEPNPYNAGTNLEQTSWRRTYIDAMEGGYFFHLMDFFGIPMSMDNTRLFYNRHLFRDLFGQADPPRDSREWMTLCKRIEEHSRASGRSLFPLASSVDGSVFFDRYYRSLTAGMMDEYEPSLWGAPNQMLLLYGLYTKTLDLKQERIRAAFELLRELASHFQPSFMSDQDEQRRMLFVQGRAAMVVGSTRDLGVYEQLCDFDVGVFDFPPVSPSDPRYGRYYVGPVQEWGMTTFTFGLTRNSRHADLALDFMRFCTARTQNERFCAQLRWYPAIDGARVTDPNLQVFKPHTQGVTGYPQLRGSPSTRLYFEQYYPAYLDGQVSFDELMDGLADKWLNEFPQEVQRMIQAWIRNEQQTEFNVSRAKARMLFREAGPLEAGKVMGSRTPYQLGLEIIELLDNGNNSRQYTWKHLQSGDYRFPPTYQKTP